jgi:hypothetical protein
MILKAQNTHAFGADRRVQEIDGGRQRRRQRTKTKIKRRKKNV